MQIFNVLSKIFKVGVIIVAHHELEVKLLLKELWLESSYSIPLLLLLHFLHLLDHLISPLILLNDWVIQDFLQMFDNELDFFEC